MTQPRASVSVITLFVADEQRSKEFYERVFEVAGVDEGHGTVIFQFDNLFLRLLRRDEAEKEMLGQVPVGDPRSGTSVQMAFFTGDMDGLCSTLAQLGVPTVYGPIDRPWGVRNAGFLDPDGHIWQFGSHIPDD